MITVRNILSGLKMRSHLYYSFDNLILIVEWYRVNDTKC